MSDNYIWNINTLDHEISNGVVVTVHWSVNALRPNPNISGEFYTADAYGTETYTADPTSPSFIPYDKLTEEVCITWVKNSLGPEQVASLESGITKSIDQEENPTKAAGVPWTTTMDISTTDLG